MCVDRVVKQLSEKASRGENNEMEIPNIGVFYVRNKIAAVRFNDYLIHETKLVSKKSIVEKKERGEMTLTRENLSRFC